MSHTLSYYRNRLRYHLWRLKARTGLFRGGLILSYHSIAEDPLNPLGLHVRPTFFDQQLEVITTLLQPVSLQELVKRLLHQKPLHNLVALTFDDGYANNLHQALPLLQKYQVPATIFVITGAVTDTIPFYWEVLVQAILKSDDDRPLPPEIHLPHQKKFMRYPLHTLEDRVRTCSALRSYLSNLHGAERLAFLQRILESLGLNGARINNHRALTLPELSKLAHNPLITIGSHTVSHPPLDRLSAERVWWEVRTAMEQIADWTGREVRYFAYPYGRANGQVRQIVRASGYEAACGTRQEGVDSRSGLSYLPRLHVGDWSGAEMVRYLGR